MSTYVDFHVLQTVPPSCVNRDDIGSPKTAVYGGVLRARVSSQAWKHAMRQMFKEVFTEDELGIRTKYVEELLKKEILKQDSTIAEEAAQEKARLALKFVLSKEELNSLFFISVPQIRAIAKIAIEGLSEENKKETKPKLISALRENPSVDMALFGRMLAGIGSLRYDATAQVAHAISTHAVQNEYDFFTAMDDLQAEDATGAGHLDTMEFNSSTLYRYATVNVSELAKSLAGEGVPDVISKFAKAFICSMPTGKQNTFANRTFPDVVYITIRSDQPVNLCGAFECPIKKSANGYVKESERALVEYASKIYESYATAPKKSFGIGEKIAGIAEILPLPELLEALKQGVQEELQRGE